MTAEKKKRRSRSRFLIGSVVVLLVILTTLAWLLLSSMPAFSVPILAPRDFAVQNRLLGQLMSELWNGKKGDSEIVLSPEEMESLLRVAANGVLISGVMKTPDAEGQLVNPYRVDYRDGGFEFVVPVYDTQWRWLFGGVMVLRGRAVPEKQGDELRIEFSRLALGRIPLPDWLGGKITGELIAGQKENKDFKRFNNTVRKIEIDAKHQVTIGYRPAELRKSLLGI